MASSLLSRVMAGLLSSSVRSLPLAQLSRPFSSLPTKEQGPRRPVDVTIHSNEHAITARFSGNTSFLGYRMQGAASADGSPDGKWLEFGYESCNHRQIPGSLFLKMNSDYEDLLRQSGGEETLHTSLIGQEEIVRATGTLAISESRKARARALIVISLMLRESLRFPAIKEHVVEEYGRSLQLLEELFSWVCPCSCCKRASETL